MNFAPEFAHHATGDFRKPIIDSGEQSENGAWRHDVMEMSDDVVGVVEVKVAIVEAERQTGQTADAEHREERHDEKHRHVETNRTAPEGDEEAGQNDDRG